MARDDFELPDDVLLESFDLPRDVLLDPTGPEAIPQDQPTPLGPGEPFGFGQEMRTQVNAMSLMFGGLPGEALRMVRDESAIGELGAGALIGPPTLAGMLIGDVPSFLARQAAQKLKGQELGELPPFGSAALQARGAVDRLLPEALQDQPDTGLKSLARAIGEGGSTTLLTTLLGAPLGISGPVSTELTLGTISAGASELARQSGAGPGTQLGVGIAAPFGTAVGTRALQEGAGMARGFVDTLRSTPREKMLGQVASDTATTAVPVQAEQAAATQASRLGQARQLIGDEPIDRGLTSGQELGNQGLLDLEDALGRAAPDIRLAQVQRGNDLARRVVDELGEIAARHGDETFEDATVRFVEGMEATTLRRLDEAVETATAGGLDTDELSVLLANRLDTEDARISKAIGMSIGERVDPNETILLDARRVADAARGRVRIDDPAGAGFSTGELFLMRQAEPTPALQFLRGELGRDGAETISLRSLWDMRSRLLMDQRAMRINKEVGGSSKYDLVQNTINSIEEVIDNAMGVQGRGFVIPPPAEKLAEARGLAAVWKGYRDRFRTGPAGRILQAGRVARAGGNPAVLPSKAAGEFFKRNGAGGREAALGFTRAFPDDAVAVDELSAFAVRSMVNKAGTSRAPSVQMDRFIRQHSQSLRQLPDEVGLRLDEVLQLQLQREAGGLAARRVIPRLDKIMAGTTLRSDARDVVVKIAGAKSPQAASRMMDEVLPLLDLDQTGSARRGFRRALLEELSDAQQTEAILSSKGHEALAQNLSRRTRVMEGALERMHSPEHIEEMFVLASVAEALSLRGQATNVKRATERLNPTFLKTSAGRITSNIRQAEAGKVSRKVLIANMASRLLENIAGSTDEATLRGILIEAMHDRRLGQRIIALGNQSPARSRALVKAYLAAPAEQLGKERATKQERARQER